jgi:hypothetical protein
VYFSVPRILELFFQSHSELHPVAERPATTPRYLLTCPTMAPKMSRHMQPQLRLQLAVQQKKHAGSLSGHSGSAPITSLSIDGARTAQTLVLFTLTRHDSRSHNSTRSDYGASNFFFSFTHDTHSSLITPFYCHRKISSPLQPQGKYMQQNPTLTTPFMLSDR